MNLKPILMLLLCAHAAYGDGFGTAPFNAHAPGPIGDTTADTGSFTVLTVTGTGTFGTLALGGTNDAILVRDGTSNFVAQRNSTNQQRFVVYGSYGSSGTNRGILMSYGLSYSGVDLGGQALLAGFRNGAGADGMRLLADASSTGAGAQINLNLDGSFQFGKYNAFNSWAMTSAGHLVCSDNTYDIGALGATRPRNVYIGTDFRAGTTGTNGIILTSTGGAKWRVFVNDGGTLVTGTVP